MSVRRVAGVALTIGFSLLLGGLPATAAARVTSNPLKAVLIGDSYSAGNGAGDYFGPRDCYRSGGNWAQKYMDTLADTRNVTFINRACSGGVLSQLETERRMDSTIVPVFVEGTVDKDDPRARQALDDLGACSTPYLGDERYDVEPLYATGLGPNTEVGFECTRYMEPQWNAVGQDTDLVMLTIGGNDVKFSDIVTQCFVVFLRGPGDCRDKVSDAQGEIGRVGTRIETFLRRLKAKMRPDAKIALAAYPQLEKNEDFELRGGFFFTDVYAVGREVRELGRLGDAAERVAVDNVNAEPGARVSFIDEVKDHFAGHEPDGRVCCRNDDRWVHEFDTTTMMEWYHFNDRGHTEVANLLTRHPEISIGSAPVALGGSVDIAFLIDTTGSMGSAIASVKSAAVDLVNAVGARTTSARFALVDYRDFPERTGADFDYPAKLQQDFTTSTATINGAIQGLDLGFGGDLPETMYAGLNAAYDLAWRPGVKKMVIVLADAPPLSPEPFTNTTREDVIRRSLEIDPVEVQFVDISGYAARSEDVRDIAARTNGAIHTSAPSQAAAEIADVIDGSLDRPYAWAAGPYAAKVGEAFTLDGRGSYGVTSDIVTWEWDVGADGTYEYSSGEPRTQHRFTAPFDGLIALRVTDGTGATGLATVVGHASVDGDEIVAADDNCPDVDNRDQEDYDGDGLGDECDPTPGRPTQDRDGVADNGLPAAPGGSAGPAAGGSAGPAAGGSAGPATGAATPPPPPPSQASGRPAIEPAHVVMGTPLLSRTGRRMFVRLSCRRVGLCTGTLRADLVGASSRVGYRVAGLQGKAVSIAVPPRARRALLRGARVRVRLTVTASNGATVTRTASVRRPRGRG